MKVYIQHEGKLVGTDLAQIQLLMIMARKDEKNFNNMHVLDDSRLKREKLVIEC